MHEEGKNNNKKIQINIIKSSFFPSRYLNAFASLFNTVRRRKSPLTDVWWNEQRTLAAPIVI